MTKREALICDDISSSIEWYRNQHNPITAACWMDEWAFGYLCALRDVGKINHEQWDFLCATFNTDLQFAESEMV